MIGFVSKMSHNDRGSGRLAVTVSQDVPFAGVFTAALQQSKYYW
jgi:hypothetical protein